MQSIVRPIVIILCLLTMYLMLVHLFVIKTGSNTDYFLKWAQFCFIVCYFFLVNLDLSIFDFLHRSVTVIVWLIMELSLTQHYIPQILLIRRESLNSDGQSFSTALTKQTTTSHHKKTKTTLSPVRLFEVNGKMNFSLIPLLSVLWV